MKNNLFVISFIALVLLISLTSDLHANDSKFRLGLQGTHFVGGLSGILDFSNPWALQAVLDVGADAIAIRVLNRFHQEQYWNAYLNGTLGIWGDDHRYWIDHNHYYHDSDFGVGFGIGIEYDWRGLDESLPPIGWNIELGASVVPDFNLDIGIGVHWKF